MAAGALRLLACAVKTDLPAELAGYDGTEAHPGFKLLADPSKYEAIESGLVFLGLAGLQDPPRPEVRMGPASVFVGWGEGVQRAERASKHVCGCSGPRGPAGVGVHHAAVERELVMEGSGLGVACSKCASGWGLVSGWHTA